MISIRPIPFLIEVPEEERNLGLVVEVPRKGYEDSYNRSPNPSSSLNMIRWRFVSDIHVVLPNVRQLTVFRSLQWKHYHHDKDLLLQAVADSNENRSVHIHEANKDTLDSDFIKVINVKFDRLTKNAINSMKWRSIVAALHDVKCVADRKESNAANSSTSSSSKNLSTKNPGSKSRKKGNSTKRQQYHIDVGYTTSQCLLGKDDLGIYAPIIKPTTDKDHVAAMVQLSSLLKHHIFSNLQESIFVDSVNVTRSKDFAQKLDGKNVLEAMRSALSNINHQCGCHDDSQNDAHPNFSPVVTFSMFILVDTQVFRLALIGYSRKAIRDYFDRRNKPDARLILEIKHVLSKLPSSRIGWKESVTMAKGEMLVHPHARQGETEFGFVADRCHMNCFRYLSAWIHYASQLMSYFSLSYEEAVGLVLGMYCDNNALCFVCVAKELLDGTATLPDQSTVDFGLTVRKMMAGKRSEIKETLGDTFTFPQRFRYCWQQKWKDRMLDLEEFRLQRQAVSKECHLYLMEHSVVGHRTTRLLLFSRLHKFLEKTIYGAGDLAAKHLIPILSVIGVLPPWMSTMSTLDVSSKNYERLVDQYEIGITNSAAEVFPWSLGFALKSSLPDINVTEATDKGDGKVDIFLAENVLCKFIRIGRESDNKYFDLVFIGQSMYVPNVNDNSLFIFGPDQSPPKHIKSCALHTWLSSGEIDQPAPNEVVLARPAVATIVPCVSSLVEDSNMIWVPKVINLPKGLLKMSTTHVTKVIESKERQVGMIERADGIHSSMEITCTTNNGHQCHTLIGVSVKGHTYIMEKINLSVVFAIFEQGITCTTFQQRKNAVAFGNSFLLLMVYPRCWFAKLFVDSKVLEEGRTLLVQRKRHTNFFLTKAGDCEWHVTPEKSTETFQYN